MATRRLQGFVLRAVALSAGRDAVTLFSAERGLVAGVARRGKGGGAAWLAPLTRVSLVMSGKEHQTLGTIREVSIDQHCTALGSRWHGLILLQHLARLLEESQAEDQPDEFVYRLVGHTCDYLAGNPPDPALLPVAIYVEAWLLHFCGVLPRLPARVLGDGEEARLQRALDTPANRVIFQVKIEDWVAHALQLESLSGTWQVLGGMWARFLSKELETRKPMPVQFDRK